MAMWYWNQDNFEGLDAIAEQGAVLPHLADFARYCKLRAAGIRKQALSALQDFLTQANALTFNERKHIVCWLLETQLRAPTVHQLLPHPAIKNLIEPTLAEWIQSSPQEGEAYRWQGCFFGDMDALRIAIELDEDDDMARACLASIILKGTDYAMHHLVESLFLGNEAEVESELNEVRDHLQRMAGSPRRDTLRSWLNEQKLLITDWLEYKSNPDGSFPEWCTKRGRSYQWPSIVYYNQ